MLEIIITQLRRFTYKRCTANQKEFCSSSPLKSKLFIAFYNNKFMRLLCWPTQPWTTLMFRQNKRNLIMASLLQVVRSIQSPSTAQSRGIPIWRSVLINAIVNNEQTENCVSHTIYFSSKPRSKCNSLLMEIILICFLSAVLVLCNWPFPSFLHHFCLFCTINSKYMFCKIANGWI